MKYYIVDTSVFIEFFRGKSNPNLETLIRENRVVLSHFVRLELLSGVRKSESERLARALSGLIILRPDPKVFPSAEKILSAVRPKGLTLGTVDLLIAAESHLHGFPVYSHDKVFRSIAATKLIGAI